MKNQREGTFQNHRRRAGGGPPVTEAATPRSLGVGRATRPPGQLGPPLVAPLGPYFYLRRENPDPDPFSPEAIPISAAIADKLRGTRIPVPHPAETGKCPWIHVHPRCFPPP